MRLLVTGAAGFIGSNFTKHWLDRHDSTLVGLDALTYAGNIDNLQGLESHKGFAFIEGNIKDSDLVQKILVDYKIDTIVHFAAETHVDRSIANPSAFIDSNIVGTQLLLESAKTIWLNKHPIPHRFHHISTDEVYGSLSSSEPAFTEENQYKPNSPYAASKAASDHLVRSYHKTYGLSTTISNCSNNFGPNQFPEKLIPMVIINILLGLEIPIYGYGINIRDWLHTEDHCRGIVNILEAGEIGETYNIGGNNEISNIDIVLTICRYVDKLFKYDVSLKDLYPNSHPSMGIRSWEAIKFVRDRLGHDERYAINGDKINKKLGFVINRDFEAAIASTVEWYITNKAWWENLI